MAADGGPSSPAGWPSFEITATDLGDVSGFGGTLDTSTLPVLNGMPLEVPTPSELALTPQVS